MTQRSTARQYLELTKPRVVALIVFTAVIGMFLAVPGLPGLNVARVLMTRYSVGVFSRGAAILRVTRGLGATGQRVRFGAPREIAELTLQA